MQLSILWLFISLLLPTGDELTPEQIATDYFFENIFEQDLSDYRVIEFNALTEQNGYFGIVVNCNSIRTLFKELEEATPGTSVTVDASKCPVRVKKIRDNSNRIKIEVKSRKDLSERTFVYITAYRRLRFVNHYILTLSQEGTEVLDVCRVSEII